MVCTKIKNTFKTSKLILLNLSLAFVFCSWAFIFQMQELPLKVELLFKINLYTKEPRERKDLEYDLSELMMIFKWSCK